MATRSAPPTEQRGMHKYDIFGQLFCHLLNTPPVNTLKLLYICIHGISVDDCLTPPHSDHARPMHSRERKRSSSQYLLIDTNQLIGLFIDAETTPNHLAPGLSDPAPEALVGE